MHEQFDGIITNILNGPNAEAILTEWALNDPKGFAQLASSRMPRAQPIDQDFQRTVLSLKSALIDMPDVEDLAQIFIDLRALLNVRDARVSALEVENDLL